MSKAAEARTLFLDYIKRNTCYEGQLASTEHLFKRKLMNPILKIIKDLEKTPK